MTKLKHLQHHDHNENITEEDREEVAGEDSL